MIAPAEQTRLINHLNAGRGLYIEGGDFGYSNSTTQLYAMFGCTYVDDGNDSTTGNVNTVAGQSGSITQGKNYNHLYQRGPDNYIDLISASGGTIFFRSQDNVGRAVSYGGPGNTYRAIHSAFVFGALRNGTNTKDQLMTTYMQYLLSTNVEESDAGDLVHGFSIAPNPCRGRTVIAFGLMRPSAVRATIYNVSGQLIRDLPAGHLTQGQHQLVWDGTDNSGRPLSNGNYVLVLDVDGETASRPIVLTK